jgi:hypothetical protein
MLRQGARVIHNSQENYGWSLAGRPKLTRSRFIERALD